MKPETLSPIISPEQPSVRTIERTGPNTDKAAELIINSGPERNEQKAEMGAVMSDVGLATIIPTPVSEPTNVVQPTTTNSNPLVAKDEDKIEKDWVIKAKKIINETKDNPYAQEEAVNKLQIDYIQKRYGRDLGAAQ